MQSYIGEAAFYLYKIGLPAVLYWYNIAGWRRPEEAEVYWGDIIPLHRFIPTGTLVEITFVVIFYTIVVFW